MGTPGARGVAGPGRRGAGSAAWRFSPVVVACGGASTRGDVTASLHVAPPPDEIVDASEFPHPRRGIEPAAARKALRAATRTMVEEEVTGYGFEMYLDGEQVMSVGGFHRTGVGWAASATVALSEGEGLAKGDEERMEVRSVGDKVWMQLHGWPADRRDCWLLMPPGTVPVGVNAMQQVEPAYVTALGGLHTTGFLDMRQETLVGELDLADARSPCSPRRSSRT